MGIDSHIPDHSRAERTCRVGELSKEIGNTIDKMEEETLNFIEATKSFTLEWIQRELEVNTAPLENVAYSGNSESDKRRLNEPAQLKEMNSRIPLIVEESLNRDDYWIHRNRQLHADISRDYLEFKKDRMKRELTSNIRMILGCAAEIFSDLKDDDPGGRVWVKERGRRKYICILRFSDEMTESLDNYFTMFEELLVLEKEMNEIEKKNKDLQENQR